MRNSSLRINEFIVTRICPAVLILVLFLWLGNATAKINIGTDGIAVHGYDVVAYFLEGRAVRGKNEFEYGWNGAKWQFSSAVNRELFVSEPERYAPQYGGFCAVCLAIDGRLADANPNAWSIIDAKLYLNQNMHQRRQWRTKYGSYVRYGDMEWTRISARLSSGVASDVVFRIAVIEPFSTVGPTATILLGGKIYESITRETWISVTHADEPSDPSARSFLNRGRFWPFPPTGLEPTDAWRGGFVRKELNLERIIRAGKELNVDAVIAWQYFHAWNVAQWPVEIYVVDIEKKRVYSYEGVNTEAGEIMARALAEFRSGRNL